MSENIQMVMVVVIVKVVVVAVVVVDDCTSKVALYLPLPTGSSNIFVMLLQ